MTFESDEYYWILPKESDDWEVGLCEKIHVMGFQPVGYVFKCALSGELLPENCARIVKIERNYEG